MNLLDINRLLEEKYNINNRYLIEAEKSKKEPYNSITIMAKNGDERAQELEKQWDNEKNYPLNIANFSINSNKIRVYWRCPDCGYSYITTIQNRYINATECPVQASLRPKVWAIDINNIYSEPVVYDSLADAADELGNSGRNNSHLGEAIKNIYSGQIAVNNHIIRWSEDDLNRAPYNENNPLSLKHYLNEHNLLKYVDDKNYYNYEKLLDIRAESIQNKNYTGALPLTNVYDLNDNGKWIKTIEYTNEAPIDISISDKSTIPKVLKGIKKYIKHYTFREVSDEFPEGVDLPQDIVNSINDKRLSRDVTSINQYYADTGRYIATFKNMKEAIDALSKNNDREKYSRNAIKNCVSKSSKSKSAFGYTWRKVSDGYEEGKDLPEDERLDITKSRRIIPDPKGPNAKSNDIGEIDDEYTGIEKWDLD